MDNNRKVKVLVIDDEKIVRDFLARVLSMQAIEIKTVEDGFEAIEAVKQEKFDLAFIDIRMPGMNGLETFRELKKIDPDLKYAMMTGYSVDELLEIARAEGVNNFFRKPFDINSINLFLKSYAQDLPREKALNILVIDDDKNIRTFFKTLLKDKAYTVTTADSVGQAQEKIMKENFDLVFLDVVLNDLNGIDFYLEVKKVKPDLDIILMTGYPEKTLGLEELDIQKCLYKPFDISKIFSEIVRSRHSK